MSLLQHIMERIRPVVGLKGWNYCVFWKLSEDQRFLELMDCCCAGTENNIENSNNNCGEDVELLFPVSSAITCRDVMFQHPRTKSCHLLSQLPSSIPLDSGIHAQTLISDQPRWLINFSNSCHSHLLEESVETRVLIPISVGLIELFVDKQVSEDQRMIDFITSQFNISNEQQTMTTNSSFLVLKAAGSSTIVNENNGNELFQSPVSPATMLQNLNLQDDISEDQIPPLHNSPMNFFQQFNHAAENGVKNLLESANEVPDSMPVNPFKSSAQGFDQDVDTLFQKSMLINSTSTNETTVNNNNVEPLASKKRQNEDRDSMNRSDSLSDCSDQNDDEDNINDAKCRRRNGNKGPQSKNLVAERNRRKKLNERLYNLRSLVPKITKLDRASILGDAIEYVMELQQQAIDLQNELERNIDLDHEGAADDTHSSLQSEVLHGNGNGNEVKNFGPKSQHGNGTPPMGASSGIGTESTNDKVQQMEPQVEVIQLDGNKFFVKVFCEHKPGGFVKLTEALNSLGLEVTNVNVTRLLSLVVNVFKVERKDSEMVEADHVRESLLELTRNPPRGWPEMSKAASEQINGSGSNSIDNYHHYHHHQNTLHLHSHQLISQPNHHIHHLP